MHFEYHLIFINITYLYTTVTLYWLLTCDAYVSGSFSQNKIFNHILESKTKSVDFVKKIQVYFQF